MTAAGVLTTAQKAEVVARYARGETATALAGLFGVSRQAIRGILRRRGVTLRSPAKLSAEQKAEVVARYRAGETGDGLAQQFGVAGQSIRDLLRRRGVAVRGKNQHTLWHEAFDVITPEAAYWLGFLFADGSVSRRPGHRPQISVSLAERDREHLLKLRAFLGSTSAVSPNQTYRSCQFSVRSERLADRICSLGRYSGSVDPALTSSRDFWRGVVDGDGSIGAYPRAAGSPDLRPQIRLVGREPVLRSFVAFLRQSSVADLSVRPHKTIYNVGTTGRPAVSVIRLLYDNAAPALTRKALVAAQLIKGDPA